jgi:hypothetical protein
MKHRLGSGRKIKVTRQSLDGIWLPCNGEAVVRRCLRNRRLLNTVIHEVLHAECKKLRERKVRRIARSLARMLWRAFGKKRWAKLLGVKRV